MQHVAEHTARRNLMSKRIITFQKTKLINSPNVYNGCFLPSRRCGPQKRALPNRKLLRIRTKSLIAFYFVFKLNKIIFIRHSVEDRREKQENPRSPLHIASVQRGAATDETRKSHKNRRAKKAHFVLYMCNWNNINWLCLNRNNSRAQLRWQLKIFLFNYCTEMYKQKKQTGKSTERKN